MELGEKLRQLRKEKGLTQEELASLLYVSRTAVSKWESDKGCPNIDSLKQLSKLYGISVDSLLSGDELLTIAEKDSRTKADSFCSLVFSLLDISVALFLFIPFFAQKGDKAVQTASLLQLSTSAPYLKTAYIAAVCSIVLWGILTLALHRWEHPLWLHTKNTISLVLTACATLLFIISSQVYSAAFLFVLFIIKAAMLIKIR